MVPRQSKKRRTTRDDISDVADTCSLIADLMKPTTSGEREKWQGWAEIESDPAFFNVMLKEFGVRGASVREIFSLDQELIESMP